MFLIKQPSAGGGTTLDTASFISGYLPGSGIPSNLKLSGTTTLYALGGVGTNNETYNIVDGGTVSFNPMPASFGGFTATLKGNLANLNFDTTVNSPGGASGFSATVQGVVSNLAIALGYANDEVDLTLDQTALVISNLQSLGDTQAVNLTAPNCTSITMPSSVTASNSYFEWSGAFDAGTVYNILKSFRDGSTSGSSIILEGASAAYVPVPEIGTFQLNSLTDGDNVYIDTGNFVDVFNYTFDASIDLSASHDNIIGIQDNPSLEAVIDYILAHADFGAFGLDSSKVDTNKIQIASYNKSDWGFTGGSTSGSAYYETDQNGDDPKNDLVNAGNTVTTN